MQIGDVLRYSKLFDPLSTEVDGLRNYLNVTHADGLKKSLLEAGINPIERVIDATGRRRRPAILISSSPHREGTESAPWRDFFDVDNGHIRYFGDAKTPGADPSLARGNRALLEAHQLQNSISAEERLYAPPIVFFRRTSVDGRPKGFVVFQGFGIIDRVERISQFNRKSGKTFTNYVFDFNVLSLAFENEMFDWSWITRRRTSGLSVEQADDGAPRAWTKFISDGKPSLPTIRRRISKLNVVKPASQLPHAGSIESRVIAEIYSFYSQRNDRFEGLAFEVAKHLLGGGRSVVNGWITPKGADGGADFIARLDIGQGFGSVKQIIYGQAKCIAPHGGVNGRDIARTVARLKRGWLGVFVTTGFFTESVQIEVNEDEYPILLVPGGVVAEKTIVLSEQSGLSVAQYLYKIDLEFDGLRARRRPEEILHV
jgi:hypothetical protein